MLPDKSVLIGHKLLKNAKSKKFTYDILSNFFKQWGIVQRDISCSRFFLGGLKKKNENIEAIIENGQDIKHKRGRQSAKSLSLE